MSKTKKLTKTQLEQIDESVSNVKKLMWELHAGRRPDLIIRQLKAMDFSGLIDLYDSSSNKEDE